MENFVGFVLSDLRVNLGRCDPCFLADKEKGWAMAATGSFHSASFVGLVGVSGTTAGPGRGSQSWTAMLVPCTCSSLSVTEEGSLAKKLLAATALEDVAGGLDAVRGSWVAAVGFCSEFPFAERECDRQ